MYTKVYLTVHYTARSCVLEGLPHCPLYCQVLCTRRSTSLSTILPGPVYLKVCLIVHYTARSCVHEGLPHCPLYCQVLCTRRSTSLSTILPGPVYLKVCLIVHYTARSCVHEGLPHCPLYCQVLLITSTSATNNSGLWTTLFHANVHSEAPLFPDRTLYLLSLRMCLLPSSSLEHSCISIGHCHLSQNCFVCVFEPFSLFRPVSST